MKRCDVSEEERLKVRGSGFDLYATSAPEGLRAVVRFKEGGVLTFTVKRDAATKKSVTTLKSDDPKNAKVSVAKLFAELWDASKRGGSLPASIKGPTTYLKTEARVSFSRIPISFVRSMVKKK